MLPHIGTRWSRATGRRQSDSSKVSQFGCGSGVFLLIGIVNTRMRLLYLVLPLCLPFVRLLTLLFPASFSSYYWFSFFFVHLPILSLFILAYSYPTLLDLYFPIYANPFIPFLSTHMLPHLSFFLFLFFFFFFFIHYYYSFLAYYSLAEPSIHTIVFIRFPTHHKLRVATRSSANSVTYSNPHPLFIRSFILSQTILFLSHSCQPINRPLSIISCLYTSASFLHLPPRFLRSRFHYTSHYIYPGIPSDSATTLHRTFSRG